MLRMKLSERVLAGRRDAFPRPPPLLLGDLPSERLAAVQGGQDG